jgi:hypothetical protein
MWSIPVTYLNTSDKSKEAEKRAEQDATGGEHTDLFMNSHCKRAYRNRWLTLEPCKANYTGNDHGSHSLFLCYAGASPTAFLKRSQLHLGGVSPP